METWDRHLHRSTFKVLRNQLKRLVKIVPFAYLLTDVHISTTYHLLSYSGDATSDVTKLSFILINR